MSQFQLFNLGIDLITGGFAFVLLFEKNKTFKNWFIIFLLFIQSLIGLLFSFAG